MKHFTFLMILLPFFGMLNAQTTKGTFAVGFHNFSPVPLSIDGLSYNLFPQSNSFGIAFGTGKGKYNGELEEDKVKSLVFGLSLNGQYFVADQLSIGLVGNFSSGSSTYIEEGEEDYKTSSTILLFGPELRYYFDTGEKTKFWLKGGASFGSVSSKYDGESNDPISLSQFGGGAGISIFPAANISIDFGLGYNVLTFSDKSDSGDKSEYINSGLAFDIGVGFFF